MIIPKLAHVVVWCIFQLSICSVLCCICYCIHSWYVVVTGIIPSAAGDPGRPMQGLSHFTNIDNHKIVTSFVASTVL